MFIFAKMKKLKFLLIFLLSAFALSAQTNIDSLINVLKTQKLTTDEKFSIYNDICYYYLNSDPQKAMLYCREALSFAEKEKNGKWITGFYSYIGTLHTYEGNYDQALDCYNQALDFAIEEKEDHRAAFVYGGIADLYRSQGKTVTALDYLLKALSLYEKGETVQHKRQQILMLNNIGATHREFENPDLAIRFYEKAEKLADELVKEPDYSECIMPIYYNLGSIFMEKNEYAKALSYATKSLELSRSLGERRYECGNLGLLANIYQSGFNDLAKAEEYANEFLAIAKQMNFPQLLKGAWYRLSTIYFEQKRYTESEVAGLTAWESDSIGTDLAYQINYFIGMANMYLENKEKATYYFEKSKEISKKSANKSFQNLLLDLETKYETEKKEARIATLEEKQKLYIGLGVIVVVALLLGMGLLSYRHRLAVQKRKMAEQQIKQLEQEKELIAARSALDAEKAEREIIARDLHDGVGAMLSVVKNNMSIMKSYSVIENKETDHFNKALDGLDKSIAELRRVAHHIMPAVLMEKGLFAALDDFCRSIPEAEFHFTEPERRFDPEKELVLYRCAYELVSNALRHAKASRIEVHLNMDEETVYLSVVDNGCGFDLQTIAMGMGINNMRTRLAAFGGRIDIFSETGNGTEANVELKM